MMNITSNELLPKKTVSETLMRGTSSNGCTPFSLVCAQNVHSPGFSCPVSVGEKRKRNEYGESSSRRGSNGEKDGERGDESVQPKTSHCVALKFHDFDKLLREEVNFEVGQIWALYDTGMPRLYAQIRKVSDTCFGLRITYLEPDPDDEKEIQWFEEELPVSAGKFRLGKNHNTKGGKVFQTGQFWSFSGNYDSLPRYYCRIQKITLIETFEQATVFKLHVNRLKPTAFPRNVIQWKDKDMPVVCGTFLAMKSCSIFDPVHLIHQIMPQASMDGNEYTILPKIGEVRAIYRFWSPDIRYGDLEEIWEYDIVEVLDDALDFKVLALEPASCFDEDDKKNKTFRAAETRTCYGDAEDGSDVIFTILKCEMIRFSHQIPASRVTKEIDGDMKEHFEVDPKTLP